jgi:hypothetical protein
MINRSLSWMLVALGVGAFHSNRAAAIRPMSLNLHGTSDDIAYQPYSLDVKVRGCSGPWLEVEIYQPDVKAADGTVRGWFRSCTTQNRGACQGKQFDYPWSPLPAGVTECNFGALSNDPDPMGLNVREAPDRNARILGRLSPPVDIGGNTIVLAEVRVIGFHKGWFLIESGPLNAPCAAGRTAPAPRSSRPATSTSRGRGRRPRLCRRNDIHAPVTRQMTLPTSSAIRSERRSAPIVTPTGRP